MPSNSFITNEDRLLSDIISNILPKADALFFLAGYFYFSGYNKLYSKIKNKPLKILIGMDIEPSLSKGLQEIYIASKTKQEWGDEDIKEQVYENYVSMISNIDDFDNQEFKESFTHFMDMIKSGNIEIRKTRVPNHAKLYLFQQSSEFNENGENPGIVITGSSNLSVSGLSDRHEINVILRDKNDYNSAKRIFDELWENSVEIASKDNYQVVYEKVFKKTWLSENPKPIYMFIRVLKEYFEVEKPADLQYPHDLTNGVYLNFEYQKDAINKAIATIQKHNGVIIADVVGLGKSIIASTVAKHLDHFTIIISSPHLMNQWERYVLEFDFNGKVYSSGLIQKAYEDAEIYRKRHQDKELLVIIDESHKYRNEATETYGYLHKLCAGNKVAVLTATPFNNRPQDIFSLIKLFQIPSKSTIQTTATLSVIFRELINKEKKLKKKNKKTNGQFSTDEVDEIGREIRDIIYPFIIRRTRLDLRDIPRYADDLKKQNITFPEVVPPKLISYDLEELTEVYEWTLDQICPPNIKPEDYKKMKKGLIGARYKPIDYLKDFKKYKQQVEDEFGDFEMFVQGQKNIASFMRRMLVSRFESSMTAFKISLDNMIESYEGMIKWIDKFGLVPIYKKGGLPDPDDLENEIEGDIESLVQQELFQENITRDLFITKAKQDKIKELEDKGIWFIKYNEIKKDYKDDIERDIKFLNKIRDKWFKDNHPEDKKLIEIKKYLHEFIEENPRRKIVIFSQYADTVNSLYKELKDEFRIINYSSSEKYKLSHIVDNFDAGIPEDRQKDEYDILVSTDAISEGYNLHRAGIIINYDIPYNPTRVIQRVGRINRINKKVFDKLYIYNCFPTYIGESETRVRSISTLKIAMIQALLGTDTKILTEDEKLQSFFAEQYRKEIDQDERKKSWDAKYIKILDEFKEKHQGFEKKADAIPPRTKIKRIIDKENGIITFAKKGFNYIFGFIDEEQNISYLEPEEGLKIFEAEIAEESYEVSKKFDAYYSLLKDSITKQRKSVELGKGEQETLDTIEILEKRVEGRRPYLQLLKKTIKNLNGLPDYCMREIRKVNLKNDLYEEVSKLSHSIPQSYLKRINNRANEIDESVETIILSEEFNGKD